MVGGDIGGWAHCNDWSGMVSNTSSIWKSHDWLCFIYSIPAITKSPSSYSYSQQPTLIPMCLNNSTFIGLQVLTNINVGLFCFSGAINSELFRNVSKVFMILMKPFLMFFFKDTVAGSQTTLHCALQEGLEPLSGCYFSNCTVRNLYAKARDNAVAKKLWEVSESLSGLSS